jgi:hypothetical protein
MRGARRWLRASFLGRWRIRAPRGLEKPPQRRPRAVCALPLLFCQILLRQHDSRWRMFDFAVVQERQDFPSIFSAGFNRE